MPRLLPPSYRVRYGQAVIVELAIDRAIREKNTLLYRILHWPHWIFVFFIMPGPLTFDLFAHGVDRRMWIWLSAVIIGTGLAWLRGRMPGTEPRPYIVRFGDDRPNPFYRRFCYTFAWGDIITFAILNLAGLVDAVWLGAWRLRQIYDLWYFPLAGACWIAGALGWLPRTGFSTKNEGIERRYFYGSVWAVALAQTTLLMLWKVLPNSHRSDVTKLLVFGGLLALVGHLARRGRLPRTRPILPGQIAVAD